MNSCRFLNIFSNTTIELSNSIPMPKASPDKVITFKVIFPKNIRLKVQRIEMGIVAAMMPTERKSLKNTNRTSVARIAP